MSGEIRCEECGRMVPFDEEADAPAPHACVDSEEVEDSLQELDFSDGCIHQEDRE